MKIMLKGYQSATFIIYPNVCRTNRYFRYLQDNCNKKTSSIYVEYQYIIYDNMESFRISSMKREQKKQHHLDAARSTI